MRLVYITLCLLLPTASVTGQSLTGSRIGTECGAGQYIHFELVTGVVYTAPEDMLDSRPGTLMLTDCIDLCRQNSTCKAANFETGLCVLFGSSAREFPGMIIDYWLLYPMVIDIK